MAGRGGLTAPSSRESALDAFSRGRETNDDDDKPSVRGGSNARQSRRELQSLVGNLRSRLKKIETESKEEAKQLMEYKKELIKTKKLAGELRREVIANEWPRPKGRWKSFDFYDIHDYFHCSQHVLDETKLIPTMYDWNVFRRVFKEVVDSAALFDDPVPPTEGYTLNDQGPPPYRAGYSSGDKGRGLFATRDIKKGELVHDGSKSNIVFPGGMAWRAFVFSLPRKKACDVAEWTWIQKTSPMGRPQILLALDISVLLNSADEGEYANVLPDSSTSSNFYATKDIEEGEELLTNYDIYPTNWESVGL